MGLGFFTLTLWRAATYPFTHDEALSFLIFNGQPYWADSANNHLLNTSLMRAAALVGNSEFILRLPNILAHVVYLTFSLMLSMKLTKSTAQIGSFVLLNANLFMLDFFFLARGYGLGLGFQMASLFLIVTATGEQHKGRFLILWYAALITAGLAVFANFTFLNFFIPLWIMALGLLIANPPGSLTAKRDVLPHLIVALLGGVIWIGVVARFLLQLKASNELYLGGATNILSDTLKSLLQASVYTEVISALWIKFMAAGVLALIGLFFLAAILLWLSEHWMHPFHYLLLIFMGAILLPILQNQLFDTPYPIERSALYILPLFAVLLGWFFDLTLTLPGKPLFRTTATFSSIVISLALTGYLIGNFNPASCYSWGYDAFNKDVIRILEKQANKNSPDSSISVGISWVFEPSLNYYRITRKLTWLKPFTREPVEPDVHDFIYAFVKDIPGDIASYTPVKQFPSIGTVLLRNIQD